MKTLKTILREVPADGAEYEIYARMERAGEISLRTYIRACAAGDGLTADAATEVLRESYQRAGMAHLCAVYARARV